MLVPWQLIHYFDNLAEQWLYGTCEDLGMHFMEGFSVDNIDLLKAEFRSSMRFFMQEFH